MCAGAIYCIGIGRVVYRLSENRPKAMPGITRTTRQWICHRQKSIKVISPLIETQAEAVHDVWEPTA